MQDSIAGHGAPFLLHHFLERTAALTPTAIVVESCRRNSRNENIAQAVVEQVSYRQVNECADILASSLRKLGSGSVRKPCSDDVAGAEESHGFVLVMVPRSSPFYLTALHAVMKAGHAWVPLDLNIPEQRLESIICDCHPLAIISANDEIWDSYGYDSTDLQRIHRAVQNCSPDMPIVDMSKCMEFIITGRLDLAMDSQEVTADEIQSLSAKPVSASARCYVIYTSGTTGKPKGVVIQHRSIVNFVQSESTFFSDLGITSADRFAQTLSCLFDASLIEVFIPIALGCVIIPVPDEVILSGPDAPDFFRRMRASPLTSVPSLFLSWGSPNIRESYPYMKVVLLGGEPVPAQLAQSFFHAGLPLINAYGPTEATVYTNRYVVQPGMEISIGDRIGGTFCYIVDIEYDDGTPSAARKLSVIPTDSAKAGELVLTGKCLAEGYLNQPEFTSEKFVNHDRLGRMYRSGDLFKYGPSGPIFLGRIDGQVKIRGNRVELGATESCIIKVCGKWVAAVACGLQNDRLVAYVVLSTEMHQQQELPICRSDLEREFQKVLPTSHIPSAYYALSSLPLTNSGKLDRRALSSESIEKQTLHFLRKTKPKTRQTPTLHGENIKYDDLSDDQMRVLQVLATHVPEASEASHEATGYKDLLLSSSLSDLALTSLDITAIVQELRENFPHIVITTRQILGFDRVQDLLKIYGDDDKIGSTMTSEEVHKAPPVSPPVSEITAFIVGVIQVCLMIIGTVVYIGTSILVFFYIPFWTGLFESTWIMFVPWWMAFQFVGILLWHIWAPVAILIKWTVIGQYREGSHPVYGWYYLRHWIVTKAAKLFITDFVMEMQSFLVFMRLMGAKIGKRVSLGYENMICRDGAWDLLHIGDDVIIQGHAHVTPCSVSSQRVSFSPVSILSGSGVCTGAVLNGGCTVQANASVGFRASVPSGLTVSSKAHFEGVTPHSVIKDLPFIDKVPSKYKTVLTPWMHDTLFVLSSSAVMGLALYPIQLGLAIPLVFYDTSVADILRLSVTTEWNVSVAVAAVFLVVFFSLAVRMLAAGCLRLLPTVQPGFHSIFGWNHLLIRVKENVTSSSLSHFCHFSGSLFGLSWLTFAGSRIGSNVTVGGYITGVIPELLTVEDDAFITTFVHITTWMPAISGLDASTNMIYAAPVVLRQGCFIGNMAVVPPGSDLPSGAVLANLSVWPYAPHMAKEIPKLVRPGGTMALMGNPAIVGPFVPTRPVYIPTCGERMCDAIYGLLAIFLAPFIIGMIYIVLWKFWILDMSEATLNPTIDIFVYYPALEVASTFTRIGTVIALKWILCGKFRDSETHDRYSGAVGAWMINAAIYNRFVVSAADSTFAGTLFANWIPRLLGARVGRRAILSVDSLALTEPDMIEFGDRCSSSAIIITHSFVSGKFTVGPVSIENEATLENASAVHMGARVGAKCFLGSNSDVGKSQVCSPGLSYSGVPAVCAQIDMDSGTSSHCLDDAKSPEHYDDIANPSYVSFASWISDFSYTSEKPKTISKLGLAARSSGDAPSELDPLLPDDAQYGATDV